MRKAPKLLGILLIAVPALAQQSQNPVQPAQRDNPATKRIYIEERIKTTTGTHIHCDDYGNCYGHDTTHTRNVSLEATQGFVKSCPAVTVTDNREAADYVLRIDTGHSTLYKQNGDVAYISPARFKVSNLVKDVCHYVQSP